MVEGAGVFPSQVALGQTLMAIFLSCLGSLEEGREGGREEGREGGREGGRVKERGRNQGVCW